MFCKNSLWLSLFLLQASAVLAQSQNTWKTSSPEAQGMSSLVLANAIKQFKYDGTNIHSLLVIKNNHLVLDASFYPFKSTYAHDLASVTKSITALLIGIAIDKKFIKSENEPIVNFFPEYKINNDTLRTVRIKDLLNMSSGFQCSWNDGERELGEMRKSKDWVKFMLTLQFANNPDAQFSYCSGNYYLLAEILQRATKMSCHEFAKKYLFKPLGFGASYWLTNYKGVNHGWGDLHISIYDFAKIGCLILNGGEWNGKQIISKEWLNKIQPLHKIQKTEFYGYGWWLDAENPDEVQAVGRGGQRLFIFKTRNLVIATDGGGGYDSGNIDDIFLQAIEKYDKNENNYALLQKAAKNASLPDTSTTTPATFPERELNRTFLLDNNEMGLRSIRFEKKITGYHMIVSFADSSVEDHPIGMNNQYKISKEHTFGLPMAIKGKWINDTLFVDYNRLCRIEDFKFAIVFKENDTMEIRLTEASKNIKQVIRAKKM
jgi:CubicO group peptidase (beta-lactamase class C family)